MFRAGLVAEVHGLLDRDHPPGKTARQALGYTEVIDHLDRFIQPPGLGSRAGILGSLVLAQRALVGSPKQLAGEPA